MVTKNRRLFLQKGSIIEVQLGSKYSCSINHQIYPIFNNSGILIYSRTIKVNESWYIALFGLSGSIEKVFSTDCVNNDLFSTFFQYLLPGGLVWFTSYCSNHVNFDVLCF